MKHRADGWCRKIVAVLIEAGPMVGLSIFLFSVAAIAGAFHSEIGDAALLSFADYVQDLLEKNTPGLILAIFIRNSTAAAVAIFLGVFFGLAPLAAIAFNGILFGAVLRLVPMEFWKLLPHGIFELPAMFLAWGLGLWIGLWIMEAPRWLRLKERCLKSLRVYVMLILPLLVMAAIIEGLAAHIYRS